MSYALLPGIINHLPLIQLKYMKAAFSISENRIAPVFDTCERIHLIEIEGGKTGDWSQIVLSGDLPLKKILRLVEMEVDILICGAISRSMSRLIDLYGIQLVPFISGYTDEIVSALISGRHDWSCFAMPGCEAPCRRIRIRGGMAGNGRRRRRSGRKQN